MAVSRVIEVSFGRSSVALVRIDTAYFYNNGILFKPTDIELPTSYQVHWADSPQASSTLETIGTAEGAPIPDDLWDRSRVIYGWIYLHPTEDSSVTGYEVRIYKNVRAGLPDGTEPTPAEQSTIDQLIGALNSAVEQTGEDVESASQSAQSAESAKTAAESARDTAGEYANDAESSAASASTSASQASTSATVSAQSASDAETARQATTSLVAEAQGYADTSAQSASASANSASQAQGFAQSASASANSASGYASQADISANTASTKASEASTSAQTASQKATEATQSASQALGYKNDAESAKTASQTAQGLAESARDTAVSAKTDAESARDDAETARDEAQSAVASISGALAEKAPVITDTASGAIASFSDGADNIPMKSLVVDIEPVQDLHGYDSPWVGGGGKNLFDADTIYAKFKQSDGSFLGLGTDIIRLRTAIPESLVGTELTFSAYMLIPSGSTITTIKVAAIVGGTTKSGNVVTSGSYTRSTITFTPTSASDAVVITYGSNGVQNMQFKDVQLEKGSSDTTFAPYENICPISGWTQVDVNHSDADMTNPTTITIDLGQTVYGGKLDVLSGVLVIDRAMIASYNGETLPSTWISDRGAYAQGATPTTGAQVVYKLATPTTVQLTPHEVATLLGVNNIWADSGDTEVEYRADTKAWIQRKIAEAIASLT